MHTRVIGFIAWVFVMVGCSSAPSAVVPSAETSTVVAQPSTLSPNVQNTSAITIQLKDTDGNDFTTGGDIVTFGELDIGSVGDVVDNGDGTYSAIYTAGTTEGIVVLRPNLNGVPLSLGAEIRLAFFFLAENGVTVLCPDARVGDSGEVEVTTGGGMEVEAFTKRTRDEIMADKSNASTTCTSGITDMKEMFYLDKLFNEDIGSWDTSDVTDMNAMFLAAEEFDQPIGAWDTGNVTDMRAMFDAALSFDQAIGAWDTGNVTDMSFMFDNAKSFNQAIGAWDTGNVTDMRYVFEGASRFDQPIGAWETGNVTDMSYMFNNASMFNQPIGEWDTGNVTDMRFMFGAAEKFDQPIGAWETGNVTTMWFMFGNASSFDQPIGAWETGNVTDMRSMFSNAASFNQDLSGWCVAGIDPKPDGFDVGTVAWDTEGRQPLWGALCP